MNREELESAAHDCAHGISHGFARGIVDDKGLGVRRGFDYPITAWLPDENIVAVITDAAWIRFDVETFNEKFERIVH